jgi:hypothetical protein
VKNRRRRWIGLGCVLAACIGVGTAFAASGRDQHTLTASHDVLPILLDKCAGCHQAGGIAPFPLTSSQDAVQYAPAIAFVTRQRIMPPWPPGPDSPRYVGQTTRQLTGEELSTIATWVAQGAKLGNAVSGTPPKPPRPAGALTLQMPVAYTPSAAEGATDDYHCFVLEPKLSQTEFVTSVQIEPGAPSIVHHVILFRETGVAAAAARSRNRETGGKGWSCFGGTGLPGEGGDLMDAPWLGAWVPGKTSTAMPAGTGVPLPRGSVIVMQVHYNLLHGAKPDRSRAVLGLRPASSHLTPLKTMLLPAPVELPCPRGVTGPQCNRNVELQAEIRKYGPDEQATVTGLLFLCGRFSLLSSVPPPDPTRITTSCDRRLQAPITVYGVAGHMHTRGRDIRLVLDPGTSKQRTLLHIPKWSFHWQDAYLLAKPLHLRAGDVLRVQCRFDNTIGAQPSVNGVHLQPRYVLWGEGTTDEMCLGLVEYTAG